MKWLKRIVLLIIVIELSSLVALLVASKFSRINLVYTAPKDNLDEYLNNRHSVTGWPTKKLLNSKQYNKKGARPNPYKFQSRNPRVKVFGDSFARGAEVAAKHCWSNLITQSHGINTENYGVDGFGTDQAYLRYEEKHQSNEDVIIACFTSDNIMRNVNQYRNLLDSRMRFLGFKPRFIVDNNGKLKQIPIVSPDKSVIETTIKKPTGGQLQHDYLLAGNGPQYIKWPFVFSFAKLFSHYLIKAKMQGKAFYADFFQPAHPSKSIQTTAKILDAFSKKSNKVLYVFFPQEQDFNYYAANGKWLFGSLIEELRKVKPNASILNLGDAFVKQPNFENEVASYLAPHKHYNKKGNQIVSKAVYNKLKALGWMAKVQEKQIAPEVVN